MDGVRRGTFLGPGRAELPEHIPDCTWLAADTVCTSMDAETYKAIVDVVVAYYQTKPG